MLGVERVVRQRNPNVAVDLGHRPDCDHPVPRNGQCEVQVAKISSATCGRLEQNLVLLERLVLETAQLAGRYSAST